MDHSNKRLPCTCFTLEDFQYLLLGYFTVLNQTPSFLTQIVWSTQRLVLMYPILPKTSTIPWYLLSFFLGTISHHLSVLVTICQKAPLLYILLFLHESVPFPQIKLDSIVFSVSTFLFTFWRRQKHVCLDTFLTKLVWFIHNFTQTNKQFSLRG